MIFTKTINKNDARYVLDCDLEELSRIYAALSYSVKQFGDSPRAADEVVALNKIIDDIN